MKYKVKCVVSENLKKIRGHLVLFFFLLMDGVEKPFVVVIKHLIELDGNEQ